MYRILLPILLILFLLPSKSYSQDCVISQVNATPLACDGNYFMVSIDIQVFNSSPGFTLAGNGQIYGTFLYSQLPITVGPLLGDDESVYEFIAWDVENPACQQFTTLNASNCGPVCHFSNAVLDSISCIMNSNFGLVELDFDHQGTTNPVFDVFYENGTEVGSWLYASLPVTITSFNVNGADSIVLTICDNNNTDCCQTFTFPPIDCNPTNCEIYNVSIDPECTGNNFLVHLDFAVNNAPSDSFTLMGNSLNYGQFGYNELPLTLGPLNGSTNIVWEFNIRDIESTNCAETAVLGIYHCPPPCDVLTIGADPVECNGNDAYSLLVEIDIEGEGDNGFSIFSENRYYGTFEYDNLPVTLPAYQSECQIAEVVTVCDNEFPGCCASLVYEALLCCGCIIYDLTAVAQPCNEENEIFVLLDFNYQNVSDEFSVSGNGEQYGQFFYDEVPVLIGPFPGDGSQFLEFVVADVANSDCFDATEIGLLSCTDICDVANLEVETGECVGYNSYIVTVDFEFENTTGDNFDLFVNGEFYGIFPYNDLPLTIQDFPGSGNQEDVITVCDSENPDCCTTLEFVAPSCECHIFDVAAIPIGCTTDSTFSVSLEFSYENLPGDFVDVTLDGILVDFLSVNDIPHNVELPEGTGTATLRVSANNLETCYDEVVIELMNCEGPQCNIFDLIAAAGDCTSDSTFALDIAFDTLNLPNDSVLIYANNTFIGQFQIQPGFIHIENFPVLPGNLTHLTVCADGEIGCCEDFTLETPDCDSTDCEIFDLVVDPGLCTSDSTYVVLIEYNSENIPGDLVTVSAGGFSDTFVDPDHHIVIDSFPWFAGGNTILTLCSVTFPECCDTYEFEIPNCPQPVVCEISNLVVNVEGCQTDSTFLASVNFVIQDSPNDSVIITANDVPIGQFHANGGHILVENFPEFPTNQTVVQVCAVGTTDCCDVYEFETPTCPDTVCNIDITQVVLGDCLTDSTFILEVQFEFDNLPADSVIIVANGIIIGQFHVNGGQILIEPFPVSGEILTEIHICAVGTSDCCDVFIFETPTCGECHLSDLTATHGPCTSDATYVLEIEYSSDNLPVDSVTVYVDTLFIGQFFNNPDFIRIENFPVLDSLTTITVCAAGAPDCCDTFTFETPICGGECSISGVVVDVGEITSDSTFSAVINFDYQSITAEGFDVYAGLMYIGFFPFNQVPIVISNFPCNTAGDYVVTVCESENLDCCSFFVFEGPQCVEPCDITNLVWSCMDGDSAGSFVFILDFDFDNVGNEGFNVVGNGNNYGNFSYENLPIQIGPFFSDTTSYQFLVLDAQFNECFELVSPGVVDCITSTEQPDHDDIFQVFNNGTRPGILALKNLGFSLFNLDGKNLIPQKTLAEGSMFELNKLPSGLYICTIEFEGNIWPLKLVINSF